MLLIANVFFYVICSWLVFKKIVHPNPNEHNM